MTKPVTIPNTFATATTAIPLSNLDADFSTVATAMNDANTYSNYAPDTGSANAYVVTLTGVSTTYSAGLRIQFKAGNANTAASTLNVNAQGAKNITYQDASAIASGTIAANSIVDVMYDGTQFLLMNDPAGGTGGDVVGPASATDNAIVRFDGTTGKLVQNSVVTIADSTGDISGVGQLNATTVDTTSIEVTNIKAKDGTAAATIADSTGVVTVTAAPVMTALTASQAVFTTAGKALTSNAITGTGNVVMSASPTLTGTISAAAATLSGNLTLSGGTANGVLYLDGSKVATSGSGLVFDSSGNLGLGVTPSDTLNYGRAFDIQGTNGSAVYLRSGTNPSTVYGVIAYDHNEVRTNIAAIGASNYLRFVSGSSERARITSGGNLLVGTTTDVATVRMQVWSDSSDNTAYFRNSNATPYGPSIKYTAAAPNNTGSEFLYCEDNTALRASIRSNGGLANYSANNVNLASDERLKKDIALLSSTWSKVKDIEVVNFRYKDCNEGDPALYGVIAQQVQPIVPELVVVTREATETDPEYYGIREQPMYWLAIKALQEAMARIETLEAKVAQLEGNQP